MAVVSNVFWYINSSKWWVFALQSYSQIIWASTAAAAVAIMNTDPLTYYTSLNSQWHLYNNWVANEAGTWLYNWSDWTAIYSNWTWSVWAKTYKTFTISWTETSTPWSFNPVYSWDAAWLTAGSWAFDDFFWYSAVLLNTSWQETATMSQTWWTFSWVMSSLWNITSWDNVMIKFPKRWIKMTKSWSTVTLSITDDPNKSSEWFQYYAHSKWQINNITWTSDAFYLWAYKGYSNSWVLKSWSWKTPTWSQTQATFCSYAKANNTNLWWNIVWFYQREFVNALYIMKYWNPDCQTIIGRWYVSGSHSSARNTWWTDSQTSASYGSTSEDTQVKLFWLEDWWGNMNDWIWWMYTDGNKVLYTQLSWYSGAISWWVSTWTTIQHSWSNYCISSIAWNNNAMFAPIATVSNSSYNTYYCDDGSVLASCLAYAGGYWNIGSAAGVFRLSAFYSASYSHAILGSRLMFL